MPEILLHYIWQQGLFLPFPQATFTGKPIEVLSLGQHNTNAGPDFLDARVKIGGQEWHGNIEIHVHSSDWYKHKHYQDPAYNNVILHVVRDVDKRVYTANGLEVEQCELSYPIHQDYVQMLVRDAKQMDAWSHSLQCGQMLIQHPSLLQEGWKKALLTMRLDCKNDAIHQLLAITQGSWEDAFYITLAHNFGFHINGVAFEQMAIQTPLNCLQKHKDSLFQLTAIFLGQSGLLTEANAEERGQTRLWNEYRFLQAKFGLVPISASLWKYLRLRPQNFPEVRIRQFAQLLHQSEFLFSKAVYADSLTQMTELFKMEPAIGEQSIRLLIINTVIPYIYARGDKERALGLLAQLPAEDNQITRQWKLLGQELRTADDSQALIHLFQHFCQKDKCLNCEIGYQIFLEHLSSL